VSCISSRLESARRMMKRLSDPTFLLADRSKAVSGADGAMASALLTGEQTAIPKTVMDDMRTSGLAHLLSISGLHVGLVAGLVMMVIRAGLALIPPVALRYPIKKWAAVAGMAAAFAYMLVVGSPVPTERSVLTTGLALGAILLDRNPLSLRLVACAAAAIMLLEPESLLGPSFQMSFGAVIALVAAFEVIRGGWTRLFSGAAWPVRIFLYIAGTVLTSVVASLATLPFSLFHFQQVQYFGVLANMIAVPITSFWVMPWGLIAYLALPLGLEEWPLEAMALGCRLIIATARTVAGLPGASQTLPAMPVAGLALITFGGLWLCLWSRSWRLLGLPAILLGLATVAFAPRPDILVTGDGKLMAVRDAGGRLMLSSQRAGRIARETWLRRDGVDSDSVAPSWPRTGLTPDGGLSCDALGCLYRTKGKTVALVKDR
jgi:competence protein ComEC